MASTTNRLLYFSIIAASTAYFYSLYVRHKSKEAHALEQIVLDNWKQIIEEPSIQFRRILVGMNANVDLIVMGTQLLSRMKIQPAKPVDHEEIKTVDHFREAFSLFFSRGAPGERYMSNEELFSSLVHVAETELRHSEFAIGGNAALIANKIASTSSNAQVLLAGPIGPRLKSLLHPNISIQNSNSMTKDEIHLILEFKQGERWGEHVAQSSSRFITSHDASSSGGIVIDMFFDSILSFKPDLVVLSGIHLLEFQHEDVRDEKLKKIQKKLREIPSNIPIHLELGSIADLEFGKRVLQRIVPYVDSMGLNEQELAFLSASGNGPFAEQFPVKAKSILAYKATEIINWVLVKFGCDTKNTDKKKMGYRLRRVHLHCLTYHMSATRGSDWSNGAAALAAGARLAGKQACDGKGVSLDDLDATLLELRAGHEILLDQKKQNHLKFDPYSPVTSWNRDDILFLYTPVLVCKRPMKTVGLGDAISATALIYTQYHKFSQK